jgi:hypothetical protein
LRHDSAAQTSTIDLITIAITIVIIVIIIIIIIITVIETATVIRITRGIHARTPDLGGGTTILYSISSIITTECCDARAPPHGGRRRDGRGPPRGPPALPGYIEQKHTRVLRGSVVRPDLAAAIGGGRGRGGGTAAALVVFFVIIAIQPSRRGPAAITRARYRQEHHFALVFIACW